MTMETNLFRLVVGSRDSIDVAVSVREYSFFDVESARELCEELLLSPVIGDMHVYIYCDQISDEAQNTLLKLLEELPKNVSITLHIPDVGLLLPTILSRASVREYRDGVFGKNKPLFSLGIAERIAVVEKFKGDTHALASWVSSELGYIESIAHEKMQTGSSSAEKYNRILNAVIWARNTLREQSAPHKKVVDYLIRAIEEVK